MRVILVGPEAARDRLRPALVEAGFEIVSESVVGPGHIDGVAGPANAITIDAIVEAQPEWPEPSREAADAFPAETLTPREMDVLARLAEGLSNKAIADALGISDQTVKFHVASIYGKLSATTRAEAVRRAFRRGMLSL